jgi:hypothetical protein
VKTSPLFEIAPVLVRLDHPVALRVGGSFSERARAVISKLFCHTRQNFPKERVKAGNDFSRCEVRPKQNMSHQVHTYSELRQKIHDDLRLQHPEWVQPNGESPICDSYDARLMELIGALTRSDVERVPESRTT